MGFRKPYSTPRRWYQARNRSRKLSLYNSDRLAKPPQICRGLSSVLPPAPALISVRPTSNDPGTPTSSVLGLTSSSPPIRHQRIGAATGVVRKWWHGPLH